MYVLHKYWCTRPQDESEGLKHVKSSSAIIVKTLYRNIVHLLVFSSILKLLLWLPATDITVTTHVQKGSYGITK